MNNQDTCNTKRSSNKYLYVAQSETTQTDHLTTLDSLKFLLLTEQLVINEESKNIYTCLLSFINNFHRLINVELANHLDDNVRAFKIPEVPNYALLSAITKEGNGITESEIVSQESKTQVYKSISRKTLIPHRVLGKRTELQYKESVQQSKNNLTEKVKKIISSVELSNNLGRNDNVNESSTVFGNKCEASCIILSKYQDEVHFKTNLNQLTEQHNVTVQCLGENQSAKAIKDSGDHSNSQETRRRLVTSNFNIINIEPQSEIADNTSEECKHKNIITETNNESSREHSISSDDLRSNSAQSASHFNEKRLSKVRPSTPSKVLNMFEEISPKNVLAKHLSALKDFSQTNGSIEMANSVKDSFTLSDSDSDILDDENFEILSQDRYKKRSLSDIHDSRKENQPGYSEARGHPLQLTGKDLSNLNQEMINAIGLFTDSGDIKPAVRNILEQQKQNRYGHRKKELFRNKRN